MVTEQLPFDPLTATAASLQTGLADRRFNCRDMVEVYLDQITRFNDYLKAVIQTAPFDSLVERANLLDNERAASGPRGPLHGIPILIKVPVVITITGLYTDYIEGQHCNPS